MQTMNNTWTSTAGPIQTKRVEKALRDFRRASTGAIEIRGTKGQGLRRSRITLLGSKMIPEAAEALDKIGDRYDWQITAENHKEIIGSLQAAQAKIKLPEEDHTISLEEDAQRKAKIQARQEEQEEAQAAKNEEWDKIMAKAPANAHAVIVAELIEDQSDSMADYFASQSTRRVAIGFRTGKREDFKQLRRAAASFEHTEHLGPGKDEYRICNKDHESAFTHPSPPRDVFSIEEQAQSVIEAMPEHLRDVEYIVRKTSVEHRENYSMGAGNYLKAGHRHSSGWQVRSYTLGKNAPVGLEDCIPDAAPEVFRDSNKEEAKDAPANGRAEAIRNHPDDGEMQDAAWSNADRAVGLAVAKVEATHDQT